MSLPKMKAKIDATDSAHPALLQCRTGCRKLNLQEVQHDLTLWHPSFHRSPHTITAISTAIKCNYENLNVNIHTGENRVDHKKMEQRFKVTACCIRSP